MAAVRRRLFSDCSNDNKTRRKLFSDGIMIQKVRCADCGFELETTASPTGVICPKCGGNRFYLAKNSNCVGEKNCATQSEGIKRISLFSDRRNEEVEEEFQKNFSEPSNDFELKLKRYSGRTVPSESCEKIFGISADDLVEKHYAKVDSEDSNNLTIDSNAFVKAKLFSKLIVSVTKVMDLDPEITCNDSIENKIQSIKGLESSGVLCPKSIIMIKKAHGLDSEPSCSLGSWAEDSGILNDLRAEFGGSTLEYPSFKSTIEDRYPDAPSGILDLLKNRGIIRISGDHVSVL